MVFLGFVERRVSDKESNERHCGLDSASLVPNAPTLANCVACEKEGYWGEGKGQSHKGLSLEDGMTSRLRRSLAGSLVTTVWLGPAIHTSERVRLIYPGRIQTVGSRHGKAPAVWERMVVECWLAGRPPSVVAFLLCVVSRTLDEDFLCFGLLENEDKEGRQKDKG
ncbi:hypothetical protein BDP81DRAFT_6758 [Colletotrichum phormii]|uniref:Uncharacterized protein n=1 Tax=Colletotrichum phormii TaxID=359342 RepID=A0AAJ0ENI6_9PEZI|nr:uncharacterized protein BDP81DRAFT_6758 [Colletotrichum phormii]KAK1655609.1 hypothetical protein BDP81DRAFT_6758 [Colletotrichum phormii]